MSRSNPGSILLALRRLAGGGLDDSSDAALLTKFVTDRDARAFEEILRRHGPAVYGLCRRLLPDNHLAEDAFQATFLVLVRNARTVSKRASLGSWLYGVAYRVSLKARTLALKRRAREREVDMGIAEPPTRGPSELQPMLDEEISRLPEHYRAPLLLCCVEGKTREEAAQLLGISCNVVRGRLDRARDRLRRRLVKRGVTVGTSALAAILAESCAPAALPTALLERTVSAADGLLAGSLSASLPAAQLAEGMVADAFPTRLRWALAVILSLGLFGGGWLAQRDAKQAGGQAPREKAREREAEPVDQAVAVDRHGDPLPDRAKVRFGTVRMRLGRSCRGVDVSPDGKYIFGVSETGVALFEIASGKRLRFRPMKHAGTPIFSRDGRSVYVAKYDDDISMLRLDGSTLEVAQKISLPESPVLSYALSPDEKTLAFGGDEFVSLIDPAGKREARQLKCNRAHHVIFSGDGKLLATDDQTEDSVRLWDIATGHERRVGAPGGSICALALSADGKYLATANRTGRILGLTLSDIQTGKEVYRCPCKAGGNVDSVAFSHDGKYLAWASDNDRVHLLDLATMKVKPIGQSGSRVPKLVFSRDDRVLFAASHVIQCLDLTTGKDFEPTRGPVSEVEAVALTPDGKTAITYGEFGLEKCARLWNIQDGSERERYPLDTPHESIGLAGASSRWVTIVGQAIRVSDLLGTGKSWSFQRQTKDPLFRHVMVSADGKVAVFSKKTAPAFTEAVELWDLEKAKPFPRLEQVPGAGTTSSLIFGVALSPDGKLFAHANTVGDIILWQVETGKKLRTWNVAHPTIEGRYRADSLAISPDGRYLAAGGTFESIIVWNIRTGKIHREIEVRCGKHASIDVRAVEGLDWYRCVSTLVFSPDGKTLAGGCTYPNVRLFDVPGGSAIGELEGHVDGVSALQFSAEGRSLLTSSSDTSALLWDLAGLSRSESSLPARLSDADLVRLCDDLASKDGKTANRAVRLLAAVPTRALPLLRKRLRPIWMPDPTQVDRWLGDLDCEVFETRRAAFQALEKADDAIEPALRRQLKRSMSLEARRQVERLLQANELRQTPEQLFSARAIQALEWMNTAESGNCLKELAGGAASRQTADAKAALSRHR